MPDEPLAYIAATDLPARVRLERMNRGWDIVELERRSAVGRTTLYHLEKGHTQRVRSSTIAAIARAFGIDVAELLAPVEAARTSSRVPSVPERSTFAPDVSRCEWPRPTV